MLFNLYSIYMSFIILMPFTENTMFTAAASKGLFGWCFTCIAGNVDDFNFNQVGRPGFAWLRYRRFLWN